jgi:hypothetical protein
MTEPRIIPVASFRWGLDGDRITEHTWISLIVAPSGAMRLLGYDMGPETRAMTGHYDHGYWLDIAADDVPDFMARVLELAMTGSNATFDDLRAACDNHGIPYTEGAAPYTDDLEKIT